MGARVVPDNRPGTHLGFRQQGSSGSVTKVHSGGRSSKLGHLKKKQANGRVLVSLHQSLHGTSVPAVLMAPVFLQHFFFSTFFKYIFVTKIHTWGTQGHAGLVHSTLHKSYKHEMNEHTGK